MTAPTTFRLRPDRFYLLELLNITCPGAWANTLLWKPNLLQFIRGKDVLDGIAPLNIWLFLCIALIALQVAAMALGMAWLRKLACGCQFVFWVVLATRLAMADRLLPDVVIYSSIAAMQLGLIVRLSETKWLSILDLF